MATVTREIVVAAPAAALWSIIGDFAEGPIRMAPGYVVGVTLESPDLRVATFATGTVLRERLITLDHDERRLVYSIIGGSVTPEHNNASMQVFPLDETHAKFVWRHDVLPTELATAFGAAMDHGLEIFKQSVEARTSTT